MSQFGNLISVGWVDILPRTFQLIEYSSKLCGVRSGRQIQRVQKLYLIRSKRMSIEDTQATYIQKYISCMLCADSSCEGFV